MTALAASLLAAPSYAQEPVTVAENTSSSSQNTPSSSQSGAQSTTNGLSDPGATSFTASLIPGFTWDATVNLNETYSTNANGLSTGGQSDWLTNGGIGLNVHEHSRRVSLDAIYSGQVYYYATSRQSTQFTNNLQAVGDVLVVPDYLDIMANAFAQPVVLSNAGIVTANGVSANGYRNSYGFSAGPNLTFALGDFAYSKTTATYGAAYFTNPNGAFPISVIPGVPGPQDTTMRTVSETLTSGPDFSRLGWSLVGLFNETARTQSTFSEKAGIGTFQYAITREISLLATGGYDAITNSVPLTKNISGPVALGGFALTFGEDFSLRVQAGQKYNSGSFVGTLQWNIGPMTAITGSATDTVTTPEGQLLNNLTDLTATLNGTLTSRSDIYANGTASSMGGFSVQPPGSQSFTQTIARYQRANLDFLQDFERDHFRVGAFYTRLTQLEAVFLGPPVTNSWGAEATYGHDITRELRASIGGLYSNYQELGGTARSYNVNGSLDYALGPKTRVYLRTDYYIRNSSQSLQSLSPFTGDLDDLRVSIGFSHTL